MGVARFDLDRDRFFGHIEGRALSIQAARIVDVLAKAGRPVLTRRIAQEVDERTSTLNRTLTELRKQGVLTKFTKPYCGSNAWWSVEPAGYAAWRQQQGLAD